MMGLGLLSAWALVFDLQGIADAGKLLVGLFPFRKKGFKSTRSEKDLTGFSL